MRALLLAAVSLLAAVHAWAQGAPQRPPCDGTCGVVQSIAPVTERQVWSPLGAGVPSMAGPNTSSGLSGGSAQIAIGPGFTNQGVVILGAAGGATYAQRPNEYRRTRWDVTLKMDSGMTRVVSLGFEPLMVQEGDYVRVMGNNLEVVGP
ncbi:MAG: hypothetical protein U1F10_11415 [Burkholderiales bacterium]